MNILADESLPYLSQLFPKPFRITTYKTRQDLQSLLPSHDVLICRSTLKVNASLLANSHLQCVATASSGTDHIDLNYLNSNRIILFDAKGCNAPAVADYVTATIAWLEKNVTLAGKQAGVIGVGEVGSRVAGRLRSAGYDVACYDPYKQHFNAEALTHCDVLCIHPNLHQTAPFPSVNLINAEFLSQLKPRVALINASRGGVVNETDLLNAQKPIYYCTDVFLQEPEINPDIIALSTLCTPHIAGHSIEAKHNAMIQLSIQLHTHFNLSPPIELKQRIDLTPYFNDDIPWQDVILERYNPYEDTYRLKNSINKTDAFLTQRHAHTHRHDFAYYDQPCYN